MLRANFNTYNNYVTDSLYQWDINQDLVITGLNLSVAPEIHFANAIMDRAIVRQSTINGGAVTVRIPNSLLQEALTIKAYVGLYDGDTFNIIESISIPIIAKERPSNYVFEDTDGEIYSFNALENIVNNAVVEFDNKVKENNQTINARVNNIIANASNTGDNAELIDIRMGTNGRIYASAGEAVRSGDVNSLFVIGKNLLDESKIKEGIAVTSLGTETNNELFKSTDYIYLNAGTYVYSNEKNDFVNVLICFYDINKMFMEYKLKESTFTITEPCYVRIRDSIRRYNMQLETGAESTTYEPYAKYIKDEYIKPVVENVLDETLGDIESILDAVVGGVE